MGKSTDSISEQLKKLFKSIEPEDEQYFKLEDLSNENAVKCCKNLLERYSTDNVCEVLRQECLSLLKDFCMDFLDCVSVSVQRARNLNEIPKDNSDLVLNGYSVKVKHKETLPESVVNNEVAWAEGILCIMKNKTTPTWMQYSDKVIKQVDVIKYIERLLPLVLIATSLKTIIEYKDYIAASMTKDNTVLEGLSGEIATLAAIPLALGSGINLPGGKHRTIYTISVAHQLVALCSMFSLGTVNRMYSTFPSDLNGCGAFNVLRDAIIDIFDEIPLRGCEFLVYCMADLFLQIMVNQPEEFFKSDNPKYGNIREVVTNLSDLLASYRTNLGCTIRLYGENLSPAMLRVKYDKRGFNRIALDDDLCRYCCLALKLYKNCRIPGLLVAVTPLVEESEDSVGEVADQTNVFDEEQPDDFDDGISLDDALDSDDSEDSNSEDSDEVSPISVFAACMNRLLKQTKCRFSSVRKAAAIGERYDLESAPLDVIKAHRVADSMGLYAEVDLLLRKACVGEYAVKTLSTLCNHIVDSLELLGRDAPVLLTDSEELKEHLKAVERFKIPDVSNFAYVNTLLQCFYVWLNLRLEYFSLICEFARCIDSEQVFSSLSILKIQSLEGEARAAYARYSKIASCLSKMPSGILELVLDILEEYYSKGLEQTATSRDTLWSGSNYVIALFSKCWFSIGDDISLLKTLGGIDYDVVHECLLNTFENYTLYNRFIWSWLFVKGLLSLDFPGKEMLILRSRFWQYFKGRSKGKPKDNVKKVKDPLCTAINTLGIAEWDILLGETTVLYGSLCNADSNLNDILLLGATENILKNNIFPEGTSTIKDIAEINRESFIDSLGSSRNELKTLSFGVLLRNYHNLWND